MSDYRVETVHIRLSEEIPGVDPNAEIDNTELAWIDPTGIDARSCGAQSLSDFYAANYPGWQEDDKWYPARMGLEAVRKMIAHHQRIIDDGEDPLGRQLDVIESKIAVLTSVNRVLELADEHDISFCFAVRQ